MGCCIWQTWTDVTMSRFDESFIVRWSPLSCAVVVEFSTYYTPLKAINDTREHFIRTFYFPLFFHRCWLFLANTKNKSVKNYLNIRWDDDKRFLRQWQLIPTKLVLETKTSFNKLWPGQEWKIGNTYFKIDFVQNLALKYEYEIKALQCSQQTLEFGPPK